MYDITNEETFHHLSYWLSSIDKASCLKLKIRKSKIGTTDVGLSLRDAQLLLMLLSLLQMAPSDISKILVGNKCDLYEERQVEEERGRKVLSVL